MSDLISRSALIAEFNKIGSDLWHISAIETYIEEAPAVEVVRCKDCKYWQKHQYDYRTDGLCECLVKYHDAERYMTEEDHFCSYGERRDEEA